jgi:hypothetical protein
MLVEDMSRYEGFFTLEYHMFQVYYPFVIYLLTLPRRMLFYLGVCVPRGAKAEREPYIPLFSFLEYSRFLVCTTDYSLLLNLQLSPHTEESWIVSKNIFNSVKTLFTRTRGSAKTLVLAFFCCTTCH